MRVDVGWWWCDEVVGLDSQSGFENATSFVVRSIAVVRDLASIFIRHAKATANTTIKARTMMTTYSHFTPLELELPPAPDCPTVAVPTTQYMLL